MGMRMYIRSKVLEDPYLVVWFERIRFNVTTARHAVAMLVTFCPMLESPWSRCRVAWTCCFAKEEEEEDKLHDDHTYIFYLEIDGEVGKRTRLIAFLNIYTTRNCPSSWLPWADSLPSDKNDISILVFFLYSYTNKLKTYLEKPERYIKINVTRACRNNISSWISAIDSKNLLFYRSCSFIAINHHSIYYISFIIQNC